MRFGYVLILLLAGACSGPGPSSPADARDAADLPEATDAADAADTPDMGDASDAADLADASDLPETADAMALADASDVADVSETTDAPDSPDSTPPSCLAPAPEGEYLETEPSHLTPDDQGINAWELPAYQTLRDALVAAPGTMFVDAWLAEENVYVVTGPWGELKFTRGFGDSSPTFKIVSQEGTAPFDCTSSDGLNTYDKELAAGGNPAGTSYPAVGYQPGDPRLSFIEPEDHCYPAALLRIAQLYDAPDAPDMHYEVTPYGSGGIATHGHLDVSQSRAVLVISGKGIRNEIDETSQPLSVDIAPTALYLLGALPEPGISHGLDHSATLLRWQDGQPLTSMLEPDCVQPFNYVLIILYDGLNSNELVHLFETSVVPLPAFFEVMTAGTVFRNGAAVGYPSVSVPGHLTVGTGMLNGHHWFAGNAFYFRKDKKAITPSEAMSSAEVILENPEIAMDLFNYIMNPEGETIFEALERHFGQQAYGAAINELTLRGPDYSLLTEAGYEEPERLDYFELADDLALTELQLVLDHAVAAPPALIYMSFYGTDDAGEANGPHGDGLRTKLQALDEKLAAVLDLLDQKGIRDQTAILLTSDHGMELQDANRTASHGPALAASGIKFLDPDGGGFIYLASMRLACGQPYCSDETGCQVDAQVTDDDTGLPVAGAVVSAADCADCSATTGPDGQATVPVPTNAQPQLHASHLSYNPAETQCL